MELYFVLLMKSHLQSYPCPLQINSFWNLGFLLGITIILQIITGIFYKTEDLAKYYYEFVSLGQLFSSSSISSSSLVPNDWFSMERLLG